MPSPPRGGADEIGRRWGRQNITANAGAVCSPLQVLAWNSIFSRSLEMIILISSLDAVIMVTGTV